jgi:hypothetical protein
MSCPRPVFALITSKLKRKKNGKEMKCFLKMEK